MKSTSVSGREAAVIEAVEERGLVTFSPQDVRRFLDVSPGNAYRILGRMVEKDLAVRLERGTYVLREIYDSLDVYAVASHLLSNGYVGFWSALHFHGMTDQVPQKVHVAATTQKRPVEVQGREVVFVRVKAGSFFGYGTYGDVVASDPEKTIVDCLRLPQYSGGIAQVRDALSGDVDADGLVKYAERLNSGAVASRLGYLLEQEEMLDRPERLQNLVSSYTELDPARDAVNPVSHWKLYVNVEP